MPRTARKPAPSTPAQERLDNAVALFRDTPSATNWVKLTAAMAAREDEYLAIGDARDARRRAEDAAHAEAMARTLAAMSSAGGPLR